MSAKSRFALPRLKLRGTIILAAGLVFTAAIGSSLLYVVSSNHAQDLRQADQMMEALTTTGAQTVSSFLAPYADAADSLARTGTALVSDPNVTSDVYKGVVLRQGEALQGSLGNYLMYTPEAKLADTPAFAGSSYIASRNYVGVYAQRGADGALTMGTLAESAEASYDDWLTPALTADKSSIVGPDNFGGVLYTTFNSIIRDGAGKGIGVSGVAFDATALGKQIFDNVEIGQGLLGVINQKGVWIVHMDPAMVGTQATDAWVGDAQKALATQPFYHASVGSAGTQFALAVTKANIPGSSEDWMVLVGMPEAVLFADSNAQATSLLIGGGIILLAGLAAFALLGSWVAKPVSKMNAVMLKIADGAYDVAVPYENRKDEIGDMAKAVEVFRQNGQRVADMTEAEAARIIRDQETRTAMMAELQRAFGQVVDAAVAGDFSRRVDAEFPDAELNALAGSVNNLVATVDRGLGETGDVLAALADTDLTKRMRGDYEGAFARLRDDTNAVADRLSGIVGQLKETSRGLKTATGEILSGANDLSERTTKQAATIEETSAAMEQLASTVLQNAERAKEASQVASTVTRTAEEGGQVMGEANLAMERITASSAKISNIIGLIDDIAFQTNLLALNASVEAARAGDAGKGFAVVAVEVRRLAQSAASASSEVKVLIDQSGAEVKAGSKLVADAASRLEAMLEAARSSNALMDGIARDSREQASAIEEVNTAVRQMDEMTQHNAALVEETNAAIEQTEAQANELDRVVDIFTVSGTAPAARTAAAPAPRGIKGLQAKVKQAAKSYLTQGNAAIDKDWSEF